MTRTFNEKIRCPKCGHEHTVETDFERWVRMNESLDSRSAGIVRFDLDVLLHKYLTLSDGKGSRELQCMMFIEVKTFMAKPSAAQADTLSILNQVMRNRRPNIHSQPRPQVGNQLTVVKSKMLRKDIRIKLFGGHLLQVDGTCPENSSLMRWDNQPITESVLVELLRFERDPDRIKKTMDHRRRSRNWTEAQTLFQL